VTPQPRKPDPQALIAHHIARLNRAWQMVPEARAEIRHDLEDACTPGQGGQGSGISRPTEAAAMRIEGLQARDRAILTAVTGIGKAIDHLERTCWQAIRPPDDGPAEAPRCPVMELKITNPNAGARGQHMRACGELAASKLDEHGNAIGWDVDGYCLRHRAEADGREAEQDADRRAEIETQRRLRRRSVA
jgi:hypothetical protein